MKDKINFDDYSYENINCTLEEQEKFAKMYFKLLETRHNILEVSPGESQSTEDVESLMDTDLLDAT